MKIKSLLLIASAMLLTLAAIVTVAAQVQAASGVNSLAASVTQVIASPTATVTESPPSVESTAVPGGIPPVLSTSMVEIWDSVCVRKVPYTILAIPETATFSVIGADGSIRPALEQGQAFEPSSCKSVLNLGGKQVVVCRGEQGISLMIQVTDGGTSKDFEVPMKVCPIKRPVLETETTPTPVPTIPPITPGP
jgi:hypothetical protein